ncbi:uncharacterized protein MCYG_00086 [Microsporum canis CBS 113480]|uniref:Uncharacterized protein n=1 Tax=Arthroderma otae (strain ATCC MYA-4605 / CBS 113480) TaxID=554155 RepID=C5FBL4_ARTOC|nr:uncharacterized protein MCYG_00086 [Microsporum canis CBS 113480]EEQ27198.1 predicted protein [Microsporum canis CBS 113480]
MEPENKNLQIGDKLASQHMDGHSLDVQTQNRIKLRQPCRQHTWVLTFEYRYPYCRYNPTYYGMASQTDQLYQNVAAERTGESASVFPRYFDVPFDSYACLSAYLHALMVAIPLRYMFSVRLLSVSIHPRDAEETCVLFIAKAVC